jgi:hypothetical protein
MADDPKPDDKPNPKVDPPDDPKPDDKPDPDAKREAPPEVKAALHKANKEAEALRLKLKEYEDKNKSELERANDSHKAEKDRADQAEARLLHLEVAVEKGLTAAQAKRLTGTTREELEADADELIELFAGKNDDPKKPPTQRPKERLRGGADPDEEPEETDPAKLAALVKTRVL